jgi:hypothetical protein
MQPQVWAVHLAERVLEEGCEGQIQGEEGKGVNRNVNLHRG